MVILPIGPIDNQLLTTPSCAYTLKYIANLLDRDLEDKEGRILYSKYIRGSLAITYASQAAHQDLLRTTAAA